VRTPLLLGLTLASVSLLLSLGACEGIVRLAGPDLSIPQAAGHFRFSQSFEFELPHHRRDPLLGWRLQPGVYGEMRINSEGFRGAEWSRGKTAGKRIAYLGDSCTMGFTIPADADVFGALLPQLLQRQSLQLEGLNFGVDGYSSHQGRILLEQVLPQYAPDYVTLYFGYNDHHYSNASDRETRFATPWLLATLERSHAYRFMRRQLLLLLRREARLVQPERRVVLEEFEENLRDMVAAARAAGAEPILLTTPLRPGIPLVQNEVPLEVDGRQTWVTQDWWVTQQLQSRGMQLGEAAGTEELRRFLAWALQQHPDWAYLHFLQARELERAGDRAGARAAMAQATLHDRERQVMAQYNERIRTVASTLQAELLDLERQFESRPSPHLFHDVVHPSHAGHKLIAQKLAETLLRLEGRSSEGG
jgi:lysophospholipase L1-like esterase